MFSQDRNNLQFDPEDSKWKGVFVKALSKVHKQVNGTLTAQDNALEHTEKLILQLLEMLCSAQPHTVQDVADYVSKNFPYPIDEWATREAQQNLESFNKGKNESE